MPFTFKGGTFNVEGSLNKCVKDNLNLSVPSWATTFPILYDYPDVPLFDEEHGDYAPRFSTVHHGNDEGEHTQGDLLDGGNRGQLLNGRMEVWAWVNLKTGKDSNNYQWRGYQRMMQDMIVKLFSQTRTVIIYDLYASLSAPSATGYIIRIDKAEPLDVEMIGPNPNVRGRGVMVFYHWMQRA